jgi:glycosyltransferase involved in cell wall biosynthesis
MKILYHHRIGSKDGQSVHIQSLISAFAELGEEVRVVSPPAFGRVSFGAQASKFALLKRVLPAAAYEILEVCYNVPAFCRLAAAYWQFRPDLIYERYNLFMVAGILLSKLTGTLIFLEVNAPLARERSAFGGLALKRFAAWIERQTWRAADLVLPVSKVLGQIVSTAGVQDEKIYVIPNGTNDAYLRLDSTCTAKAALGLNGKTVLGFTGFVRDWHGLQSVIDLLADPHSPTDLHLIVVGDGPALVALKERAEELGVSTRVTFAGLVDQSRLPQYLAAFDIALQPSAVDYASPLKLFEYMATGKAIVAPNQANIREVVADGKTALLFDPPNQRSFRDAVLALAHDYKLRQDLGRAARQSILDRGFTWTENARRVSRLFTDAHTASRSAQRSL